MLIVVQFTHKYTIYIDVEEAQQQQANESLHEIEMTTTFQPLRNSFNALRKGIHNWAIAQKSHMCVHTVQRHSAHIQYTKTLIIIKYSVLLFGCRCRCRCRFVSFRFVSMAQ